MNQATHHALQSGIRVAHSSTTPWSAVPPHRGGTIKFKTMLEGSEGSPDNYQLLLADTAIDFKSPRHRHNFDQLRFSLEGPTNFGPKQNLEQGDLAYFPEGTYYGPQDQELVGSSSLSLVIQFGGPSGNGYMSKRQLEAGFDQLLTQGSFEGGVFKRHLPAADGRKNQDSYEAIWEAQNGRPVAYEKPRFTEPVHLREGHFAWKALPDTVGVYAKHLASFTECNVSVDFLRLDAGASHQLATRAQTQLLFIQEGTGELEDGQRWAQHTAVHVPQGQPMKMRATTRTDAMLLLLPAF